MELLDLESFHLSYTALAKMQIDFIWKVYGIVQRAAQLLYVIMVHDGLIQSYMVSTL